MRKGIIFALLFVFLLHTTALAHQIMIEPLPQKRIKVRYEDGKFSQDTTITLFNAAGQIIFMKKVDENGEFDYSRYSQAASLMADDGMGHRVIWKVGQPVDNVTGKEKWVRIGLIVCVLTAIGFAFYERTQRKRLEKEIVNSGQKRGGAE
ncbi:MAG: hypothetical protein N2491_12220 [Negativicutes bacterium]|nr:hypothetical protein [Negativicutes bacterium]